MLDLRLTADGLYYKSSEGSVFDRVTNVTSLIGDGSNLMHAGASIAAAASYDVLRAAVNGESFARPSVYQGMPCTVAQDVRTWSEKDYERWVTGRVSAERQRALDRGTCLDAVAVALCEGHVSTIDGAADYAETYTYDHLLTCDPHEARSSASALAAWWKHHDVKPSHWQLTVSCQTRGIAGTLDMIAVIRDELWLIDFKAGHYRPAHALQVAAYWSMVTATAGLAAASLDAAIVSVIPRSNGEGHYTQFRPLPDISAYARAFDSALNVYRQLRSPLPTYKSLSYIPGQFERS